MRVTSTGFSEEAGLFLTAETTVLLAGFEFFTMAFAFGFDFETTLRVVLTFAVPFFTVDFTFATTFVFDLVFDFDLTAIIHFLTNEN